MTVELESTHCRIVLDPQEIREVSSILRRYLPRGRVLVFGSRCRGWSGALRVYPGSDLDLALCDLPEERYNTVGHLRLDFEESNLPFRVDLIVLTDLPAVMQARILQEAAPLDYCSLQEV